MRIAKFIALVLFFLPLQFLNAQKIELNYLYPNEYEVGDIEIVGADHIDRFGKAAGLILDGEQKQERACVFPDRHLGLYS